MRDSEIKWGILETKEKKKKVPDNDKLILHVRVGPTLYYPVQ